MKWFLPLTVLLLAGCFVRAQDGYYEDSSYDPVSVDAFGPALDPYGAWVVLPGYGRAWQPSLQYVGADFYPYGTGGRWVYTNAGWVFDSDYPFGWAVFHYGRWYRDASSGWLWIPGRTWGPAWVSWRAGGPYVGWAPLGPRGVPGYDSWCFVPADRFTTGYPRRYSLPPREYHRAVAVTEPVRARRRGPVGPPPSYVSSRTRERIVPVPLTQVPSARTPPRERGRFNTPARPPTSRQPGFRQNERVSPPPQTPGRFGAGPRDELPPPRAPGRLGAERGQELPPPPQPPGRFDSQRREELPPPPQPPGRFGSQRREELPPPPQTPGRVGSDRREVLPPPAPPPGGRFGSERREDGFSPPPVQRTQPSAPGPGPSRPQPRVAPPTFNAPPRSPSAPAQPSQPTKRSRSAPPPPPPPPRR